MKLTDIIKAFNPEFETDTEKRPPTPEPAKRRRAGWKSKQLQTIKDAQKYNEENREQ